MLRDSIASILEEREEREERDRKRGGRDHYRRVRNAGGT